MKDTQAADADAGPRGDSDPWVQEGLRALREQSPSESSRRATLAQLGIGDAGAEPAPARVGPATGHALVRWLLAGALLGLLASLLRWLG